VLYRSPNPNPNPNPSKYFDCIIFIIKFIKIVSTWSNKNNKYLSYSFN